MGSMQTLNPETCRKARLSRDARFDGQFFTAVKTTGIFCRPVCPVVPPKEENVEYFPSAAAAMEAGFRPCLRCRPETAPQSAAWKGIEALASKVLRKIDAGFLAEHSVPELAESMGISERYVRDLCQRYAGASPSQLEQARRALLAKQLLFDSSLSIADIAFAAGYQSLRRFNEHWKAMFGKTPREMRRNPPEENHGWIHIRIPVTKHFDADSVFDFLKTRLVKGTENMVQDEQGQKEYQRVLLVKEQPLLIRVKYLIKQHCLAVYCEQAALPRLQDILSTVKRVFDVDAHSDIILQHLSACDEFKTQLVGRKDIRLPGAFDPFEAAMRAVVGQQVSVKAACTLLTRLSEHCGAAIPANESGFERALPDAQQILAHELDGLGLTAARIASLKAIAQLQVDEPEVLSFEYDIELRREKLLAIKGIGPWTVSYLEMRAFSLPDAFPAGDLGVRIALQKNGQRPSEKQVRDMSSLWAPWRAYATLLLWQRL